MRFTGFLFSSIFLIGLLGCSESGNKKEPLKWKRGEVYENVAVEKDTTLSYALYFPSDYSADGKNKALFFFDAHARGVLPVERYQALAEKYHVALFGSNQMKNGLTTKERNRIITHFLQDAERRFHIDQNQLFTAGFSGGARVAALVALYNQNVKGVIGCGAGFPQVRKPVNQHFVWVGIVGNRDFNYLEMKNLYSQLRLLDKPAFLLSFDGKHEWPPEAVMDEAFQILFRNRTNDLLYGIENGMTLTDLDRREITLRDALVRNFTEKDSIWWRDEIQALNKKRDDLSNKDEALMNARLLSYLGMVSYLFCNSAVKTEDDQKLRQCLYIYRMVEPENPDRYYFQAVYEAHRKNYDKAITLLKKAVSLGLEEPSKILSEKAFEPLKEDPAFNELLNSSQK